MPLVPTVEAPSVEEQPLPGRAYPRFSEEAPEAAFGTPVGQGLQHLAEAGVAEEAKYKQQADQLRTVDAITQLSAGVDAMKYGQNGEGGAFSIHGKDAFNLPGKFMPAYDELAGRIASGLTPDQQRMFMPHIQSQKAHLNEQLNLYEFDEHNRWMEQTFKTGRDQAVKSAGLNYRDPKLVTANIQDLLAINSMEAKAQGWTPAQQHQHIATDIATLHASVIDSMLADGEGAQAKGYYNAHADEFKEALGSHVAQQIEKQVSAGMVQQTQNQVLAAYAASGNEAGGRALNNLPSWMTDVEKGQVVAGVNRGLNERAEALQQDPANKKRLDWLDDQIASRQVSPQALGVVENLYNQGVLTSREYRSTRNEIMRAQRTGAQNDDEMGFIDQHMKDGKFLEDPQAHEKGVNLYYAEATMGEKQGSDRGIQVAVDMSHILGVIPKTFTHYVGAAVASGTPQEAAKASRAMELIRETSPAAYEAGFDKRTQTMAYAIAQSDRAGLDPEQAVEIARKNADLSTTQRQMMEERWRAQKDRAAGWYGSDVAKLREKLADDERFTTPGKLFGRNMDVPPIPSEMVADYQLLTREIFLANGGNYGQAEDLALHSLKGTWGVYGEGEDRKMMKWSPTAMFPGVTVQDINHDLAVKGFGAAKLIEAPGVTGASGGRIWNLGEPDQYGLPRVITGSDGRPVQYPIPNHQRDPFAENLKAYEHDEAVRAQRKADEAKRAREEEAAHTFEGGTGGVPRI